MEYRLIRIMMMVVLLIPNCAYSAQWGNKVHITGIYVYANGAAYIATTANQNPDNCTDSRYLAIQPTAANFKMIYSTALTAYAAGKTVSINYDGCTSGGYPVVNSIAVPNVW